MKRVLAFSLIMSALLFTACQTTSGVRGNETGSSPVNDDENIEYHKAIVRCNKTGGTRVVKIEGVLRCF